MHRPPLFRQRQRFQVRTQLDQAIDSLHISGFSTACGDLLPQLGVQLGHVHAVRGGGQLRKQHPRAAIVGERGAQHLPVIVRNLEDSIVSVAGEKAKRRQIHHTANERDGAAADCFRRPHQVALRYLQMIGKDAAAIEKSGAKVNGLSIFGG